MWFSGFATPIISGHVTEHESCVSHWCGYAGCRIRCALDGSVQDLARLNDLCHLIHSGFDRYFHTSDIVRFSSRSNAYWRLICLLGLQAVLLQVIIVGSQALLLLPISVTQCVWKACLLTHVRWGHQLVCHTTFARNYKEQILKVFETVLGLFEIQFDVFKDLKTDIAKNV